MYDRNVQMTMNEFGAQDTTTGVFAGDKIRQTQKTGFINNTTTATINGQTITERQSLSKALRPKADN